MSRPKVYILQEPFRRDEETGEMVPVMDFRKVISFGDPVVCLKPGRVSLSTAYTVDTLREVLSKFTDEDYIVSVGDPTAIFIAAMVIGDLNVGKCKMLKWDKDARQYVCVEVDIHHRTRRKEE
jgi:hypothetical protein